MYDTFDKLSINGAISDWNIYAPQWAQVNVVAFPDEKNKSLELSDSDPYDYAKVVRIFKEGTKVKLQFNVFLKQCNTGMLRVDVADRFGNRPVRLWFDENGILKALDGSKEVVLQKYMPEKWYQIELEVNANVSGNYNVKVDGKLVLKNAQLAEAVKSVERLSFCTGTYRTSPNRKTPNQKVSPPLEGADEPVTNARFYIDEVQVISK